MDGYSNKAISNISNHNILVAKVTDQQLPYMELSVLLPLLGYSKTQLCPVVSTSCTTQLRRPTHTHTHKTVQLTSKLLSKQSEKHGEVERTWSFRHHPIYQSIRRFLAYKHKYTTLTVSNDCGAALLILTQRCQHILEIFTVDEAISVLVYHVEGLKQK